MAKMAIAQVADGEKVNRGTWKYIVSMRSSIPRRVRKVGFVLKERELVG